jgi:hypothetical protein
VAKKWVPGGRAEGFIYPSLLCYESAQTMADCENIWHFYAGITLANTAIAVFRMIVLERGCWEALM